MSVLWSAVAAWLLKSPARTRSFPTSVPFVPPRSDGVYVCMLAAVKKCSKALVSTSVLVTTSKALVTRSDALVPSSFLLTQANVGNKAH